MVWKKVGVVGVDSGNLLLADPAYMQGELPSYRKIVGLEKSKQVTGKLESPTAQIKFKKGHAGAGVRTATGYGDGLYDVYADEVKEGKHGKRVAEIRVVFIDKRSRSKMDKLV